jgi:hypothetical protein
MAENLWVDPELRRQQAEVFLEAESDHATWLEYFKLSLEGVASVYNGADVVVSRAEKIADAAVAKLKERQAKLEKIRPPP